MYSSLEQWIEQEAIPFFTDSPASFNAAVDRLLAALGEGVELLGFGEALHGAEQILALRNRLFQHLVQVHGYTAIAIESSFPRARIVNEFITGRGSMAAEPYESIQETGFSHGFGGPLANRELVEWLKSFNLSPLSPVELQFYGFDSPTEMMATDSPRQLLEFVLDYL